jgi:hypothetical protein
MDAISAIVLQDSSPGKICHRKNENPCEIHENTRTVRNLLSVSHSSCVSLHLCQSGFALKTKLSPFDTITCFCSYATMTRIPKRFPTTSAIVSGLTRLLRSCAFIVINLSRCSTSAGYSSVSGPYKVISYRTLSMGSSRAEVFFITNRLINFLSVVSL